MFDEMSKMFVDGIEEITDTSNIAITDKKEHLLEEREERDTKREERKQEQLKEMEKEAQKMHQRNARREALKEEVRTGGNTYLDITMNQRTDAPKKSKYLGLLRTWEKRSNTNGVGTVSLTGIISEENIMKYHKYIASKYTFIKTDSYKSATLNRATNETVYTNDGDRITFRIHTTKYTNPTLYEMVIEYVSKEELLSRNN